MKTNSYQREPAVAVAGFLIALFAIHEGREAWEGELVEDHDHDQAPAEEREHR